MKLFLLLSLTSIFSALQYNCNDRSESKDFNTNWVCAFYKDCSGSPLNYFHSNRILNKFGLFCRSFVVDLHGRNNELPSLFGNPRQPQTSLFRPPRPQLHDWKMRTGQILRKNTQGQTPLSPQQVCRTTTLPVQGQKGSSRPYFRSSFQRQSLRLVGLIHQ